MSTTVTPTEDLASRDGIYPAMLLPFDEPVRTSHDLAGRRYTWADVRLPTKPELKVTADHARDVVGIATAFAKTRAGVTCRIKLGRRGTELLRRGHDGISAEVNEDTGEIFGVSLIVNGTAGFASARILDPERKHREAGSGSIYIGVDPMDGALRFFAPTPAPPPVVPLRHASGDMSAIKRELAGYSMAAVHARVAEDRARFYARREELAQADVNAEEARLMKANVPAQHWPEHLPGRKRWDAYVEQVEARERREYEGRRAAQFLEFQMAAAAVPPPRLRWWRRLWRRRR